MILKNKNWGNLIFLREKYLKSDDNKNINYFIFGQGGLDKIISRYFNIFCRDHELDGWGNQKL